MFIKQINKSLETAVLFGEIDIDKVETTLKKLSKAGQESRMVQLCSARYIVSHFHVFAATEQAAAAIDANTSNVKAPELEFLRRLTAERQIEKAISNSALAKGKNNACLVVVAKEGRAKKIAENAAKETGFKESNIDFSENAPAAKKFFKISDKELETLSDLENPLEAAIIERIALLGISQ